MLDEIGRLGDFEALLFAAARAPDAAAAQFYYQRANAVMPCDLNALARKAEFAFKAGRPEDAAAALDVALALSPEQGWQQVKLADIHMALGSLEDREAAFQLFVAAHRQGYQPASRRLLDWYASGDGPFYDETLHEELLLGELRRAGPSELYSIASKVGNAPEAVATRVLVEFDLKAAYGEAAAAGDPVAMRELAKMISAGAATDDELAEAARWLNKAATAGDPAAMLILAQAYAFGLGMEPSPDKARLWLQAAASAGNEAADDLLSIMRVR
nr:hypothetical protein [Marinicella sp. W31]MDC2878127.1 hypothetical protein [Marinicella sp. W31]